MTKRSNRCLEYRCQNVNVNYEKRSMEWLRCGVRKYKCIRKVHCVVALDCDRKPLKQESSFAGIRSSGCDASADVSNEFDTASAEWTQGLNGDGVEMVDLVEAGVLCRFPECCVFCCAGRTCGAVCKIRRGQCVHHRDVPRCAATAVPW